MHWLTGVHRDPGEPSGSGSSAVIEDIVKEVKSLKDTVDTRVEKIELTATESRNDLSALMKTVEGWKENGLPIDQESTKKALEEILDKQELEHMKERSQLPSEHTKCVIPDVWKSTSSLAALIADDVDDINVKGLLESGRKGFDKLMSLPPIDQNHKALCHMATEVKIADAMARLTSRDGEYLGFKKTFPKLSKLSASMIRDYARAYDIKATGDALDLTDTANWVTTGWSSEIHEIIQIQLAVAGLFERIVMPQDPYILPVDLTDVLGDFVGETTDVTNPWDDTNLQKPDDQRVTFTSKKLRARMLSSGEIIEDAIIPLLSLIRRRIVNILAQSLETAIINGDDSGTHMDNDTDGGAATLPQKMFDGLRQYAFINTFMTDASAGPPTITKLNNARKEMGEYGIDNTKLAHVVSMSAYIQSLDMAEVKTIDLLGPLATVLTGQLASVHGSPIIVSRHQRQDIAATGVNTVGGPNSLTNWMIVCRQAWMIGDRRRISLEAERLINTDQTNIVTFQRVDFENVYAGAASPLRTVWMLRNMSN